MKNKTALVTGSSRGIGRAIALELARMGCKVAINCSRDIEKMEETLKELKRLTDACAVVCDVSDFKSVSKMIKTIGDSLGDVDILVNNAGISHRGLFQCMTEEEIRRIININLIGTLNVTHAVLPYMLSKKRGTVINISSIWGNRGASCEAVYSASKGAINAFTQALAKELGPSGIRVNAISPGCIDTDMNNSLEPDEKTALAEEIPLMRFGSPEETARAVAFLTSPAASYINGQILTVDGGFL